MLYRPKEGKGQGTAGWSATLQDFRQNTSFASKEYPDMGTEFGCKICILCADSLHPRKARFPSFHIVCRCVFASFDSSTFWLLSFSALFAVLWFCLLCFTTGYCIHCQKAICVFSRAFFGRRNNGLKFRSGLPVAAILRCGSGLRWQQPAKLRAGFGGLKTARKHCHGQGASTVPEYPLQTLVK